MKTNPILHALASAATLLLCEPAQAADAPATVYNYDTNNQLSQVTYADGRHIIYAYDDSGNITSITTKTTPLPAVLVSGAISGKIGAPIVDYQIVVNNSTGIIGFNAVGLPAGLALNKGTTPNSDGKAGGVIYGIPTVSGKFTVQLSAKNADGASFPVPLIIDIANPFGDIEDGFNLVSKVVGTVEPSLVPGAENGGRIDLAISKTGTFSGKVTLGTKAYSVKGKFDGNSGASGIISIPRTALTIALALDLSSAGRGAVTGTLTDGSAISGIDAHTSVWNKVNQPSDFAAASGALYNVALEPSSGFIGLANIPQGAGFLQVKIDKLGSAKITGKLADGTALSTSSLVWADGSVPLFVALYKAQGSLFGKLHLDDGLDFVAVSDNAVAGTLAWSHPDLSGQLYPTAFDSTLDAFGGAYTAPAKGFRVMDLGNGATHPTISLELSDGGLVPGITSALTLNTGSKVTLFTPDSNSLKLTFTPSTGLFSGKFTASSPARTTAFQGILLPASESLSAQGFGYFLLPGATRTDPVLSGHVLIDQ